MRKRLRMRCPTCDSLCSVVNGPPYLHYACATHGAIILARPEDSARREVLAAAERAVKDAAMESWRHGRSLPLHVAAACAALAKLEGK